MASLTGKVAVITGGAKGIGLACAERMAADGAKVVIADVEEAVGQSAASDISKHGREALFVHCDVARKLDVRNLVTATLDAYGAIDVLVNNAGIDGKRAPAWEIALEDWRAPLEVNLFGAFACAREALGRMVPRRAGVIVNVSSVHDVVPWGGHSAYAASKAGLGMLTKTLALEAAEFGVRVLAVAPGAIRTPINEDVWATAEGRRDLQRKIAMGRVGEPAEVAGVVVSLAGAAGGYVTGTTVYIDGGMCLYPEFRHGG